MKNNNQQKQEVGMIRGCLYVVRGMDLKLQIPGPSVQINPDGTIWYNNIPLLGIQDTEIKAKAAAAINAKRWSDIPADAYTRLGDNANGLWAGDDTTWATHPVKIAKDADDKAKAVIAAMQVIIHLSTRGCGDYSSCTYLADLRKSDAELLAGCKAKLASGVDVDNASQSDEVILAKIAAARSKHAAPKSPKMEVKKDNMVCPYCGSYCDGDCGRI